VHDGRKDEAGGQRLETGGGVMSRPKAC